MVAAGRTQSVGALLAARAAEHPDRPFLWCDRERITYAQMDRRASSVAAGLTEVGVARADRVAVIAPNRPEVLELFFGLARSGAVNVPLNVFLKGDFLQYQLQDCGATTVVADEAGARALAEVLDETPAVKRVILLDHGDGPASLERIPYARVRTADRSEPTVTLSRSSLMSIMYTSGTTGMPKGCMLPHGWYLTTPESSTSMMGYGPGDVLSTALPMFHAWAQGMVMGALVNGLEAVVDPLFRPGSTPERWAETGATLYAGVGMMALAMMQGEPSATDRAHRLRCALIMPMTPDEQGAFEDRFGCMVLSQIYGQTECGAIAYCSVSDQVRKPGTMGHPSPGYSVRLVDEEDQDVPAGEVGEVVVRPVKPHGMFQGYWGKPEATAEAWRNLWHHTGDYARADADGFLIFVDRKSDSMRRRGENVSSIEVERAISRHPAVADVAVHAVPSSMTEDDIKACVVLAPGASVAPEELFAFFKAELPYFCIPRYVELVDELPRNATMRVMKHRLRARGVTDKTWDFEALGLTIARAERR